MHLRESLVNVDGPAFRRVLEDADHGVLEDGAIFFFRPEGRLLGALARGHVVRGHQHRFGILKHDVVAGDFDIEDCAVIPAMLPDFPEL